MDEDEKKEELALIKWQRPKQFLSHLLTNNNNNNKDNKDTVIDVFVNGAEASDVVQGDLEDCYLLSAACVVAVKEQRVSNNK